MEHCTLCPRACGADRMHGELGFCGETADVRVARASLHMWEEPCISGERGSGTVFFSGCSMHCVFCQNQRIANGNLGRTVSETHLAEIFIELQEQGAHNINLVTAGHFAPRIADALRTAKSRGLCVPVVYNTGSYETAQTLRLFDGLVDIYLPDFKYWDKDTANAYARAGDYPDVAKRAIAEMVRQVGEPKLSENGLLTRGVLVRHLLLPGHTKEAKEILSYLYETYGDQIFVSIMNQYTPMEGVEGKFQELGRKVTKREYEKVVDYAIELGMTQAFIQEGDVAKESFIPAFDFTGV